jgi:hypothetical protein
MELHVWHYSVVNLQMRACCVDLVPSELLHGCNIELPMKIVNRLRIVSLKRGTGQHVSDEEYPKELETKN